MVALFIVLVTAGPRLDPAPDSYDLLHCLVILDLGPQTGQSAVAHGQLDLCMTKQFLDSNVIGTAVEQLGSHRMQKLVTASQYVIKYSDYCFFISCSVGKE